MATLDENKQLHGHIGDMVYQVQNGQQTQRSMPEHYNDRKSDSQLTQREKMKAAQRLYRQLKTAVKGCFEHTNDHRRDCDSFMSMNLLKFGTVSAGSLPTLKYRINNGQIECDMIAEDWKKGDILRFITLTDGKAEYEDTIIDSQHLSPITYHPSSITQFAFVHLRDSRKGRLASTQVACKV